MNLNEIENIKNYLSGFTKYQWIKTERKGTITEFKDVIFEGENLWVDFVDGSRINYNLLDEFILKTSNEYELLELDQKDTTIPQKINNVSVRQAPPKEVNPIHTLLSKQKSNPILMDLALEMNIPSIELYNVICQSFDNANEEVLNYIISGLDINMIKDNVKKALCVYYKIPEKIKEEENERK